MCSIAFPSESTTDTLTRLTNNPPPTTNPAPLSATRAARNKQNAQHATGPRTPAGKARSAQNARTHGLSSTLPPTNLPVPDPTANLAYTTLKQELLEEHRPTTPTQQTLLDELTLIIWKLQYLPRIEHRLLNTPLPDTRPQTPLPNPLHLTPHPRLDAPTDNPTDPTAATYALHLMQDQPTALLRLHALHHRLQARMNSILNQFRRLRKDQQHHQQDDEDRSRGYTQEHRAQEKHDHQIMDQEVAKMKQNIQARQHEERQNRQHPTPTLEAPVQIKPTQPPPTTTPPALPNPLQQSLASSRLSNTPAQIQPTPTPGAMLTRAPNPLPTTQPPSRSCEHASTPPTPPSAPAIAPAPIKPTTPPPEPPALPNPLQQSLASSRLPNNIPIAPAQIKPTPPKTLAPSSANTTEVQP